MQDGSTSNDNACNYVDCLLCDAQTKYTFHTMQQKLFASKAFSPQAIYDTFNAETPLMNFDFFTELHDEYQLAHKELVPSSILIAATIQKQGSSIPLKALFDPGSDLTFIHEKWIPHGLHLV